MTDFMALNWNGLFVPTMPIAEAVFRGTVLFLAILALFRVIPKRLIGRLALVDLLVVTIVAGVARNGLIRDAYSLTDGLVVIATIIGWSYVLDWASYHNHFIHSLLHQEPVRLIKDGVVDEANLEKELVTKKQLYSQLRAAVGNDAPAQIAEAWMESNGRISAKVKTPSTRWDTNDTSSPTSGISETTKNGSRQALLLIDVINHLDFPEGTELLRFAVPMAENLAALADRARAAGTPVIYVNDNFGHWRSDFRATIDHCLHVDVPGRVIAQLLLPKPSDYFVLKPRHSAFYSTTLETLLRHLEIDTLIVTGIAGNICVLFTAYDAYLRGYRVIIPSDCIASNSQTDSDNALAAMRKVIKAETPLATEVDFFAESAPNEEFR